ncbi:MAG: alpha/beta hydrolase [Gemmatimonadota bacterium]|nr:alpha/beta hydrolase [Gemmatimonadota bacterium]
MQRFTRLVLAVGLTFVAGVSIAQEPSAPNGRIVQIRGSALYFEDQGSGPPLLLIHGFGSSATFWRALGDSLKSQFRVIAVDLPGHARSDARDSSLFYSHADAAKSMIALLDTLAIPAVGILGNSSGGMVGLYMAAESPSRVTSLVTMGSQIYYSKEAQAAITAGGPDSAKAQTMTTYATRHGSAKGMLLARQFWAFRQSNDELNITPQMLGRITARTLVTHGSDDSIVPVSQAFEIARGIRGSHLWVLAHAGHNPFPGDAGRVELLTRLRPFLAGAWTR